MLALVRFGVTYDPLGAARTRLAQNLCGLAPCDEIHPGVGLLASGQLTIREYTFGEAITESAWCVSKLLGTLALQVRHCCERVLIRNDALAAIDAIKGEGVMVVVVGLVDDLCKH